MAFSGNIAAAHLKHRTAAQRSALLQHHLLSSRGGGVVTWRIRPIHSYFVTFGVAVAAVNERDSFAARLSRALNIASANKPSRQRAAASWHMWQLAYN